MDRNIRAQSTHWNDPITRCIPLLGEEDKAAKGRSTRATDCVCSQTGNAIDDQYTKHT